MLFYAGQYEYDAEIETGEAFGCIHWTAGDAEGT
jgi:hypothetical protein